MAHTTSTTRRSPSQNATSMGKRMATVWTERAGRISRAPSTPSRPSRPRSRALAVSAISSVASTSPSRTSHATGSSYERGDATAPAGSDVEADLQHVAVDHLVVLALDPELAGFLGLVPRAQIEELVPPDDLGPDEAPLQVGVDDPGALGRLGAGPEGPRPALLVTGGEEGAPPEEVVGGPGHPRKSSFPEAEPLEQLGAVGFGHLGRLRFQLHTHAQHLGRRAELVRD